MTGPHFDRLIVTNGAAGVGCKTILGAALVVVMSLLAACSDVGVVTQSSNTVISISVMPVAKSLPVGVKQQMTATAAQADGRTQDVTGSVTWSSSSTLVATVDATGVVTALAAGSSTITASLPGISGSTAITVTPPALVSVAVAPATASVAAGNRQQFTATGTYTDGSTQSLTAAATWSSSNAAVASISNVNGSNGLATSLRTGQVSISAQVSGITSTPAILTVTPATLVSIAVTPGTPSVKLGNTQQFSATGTYTDSSTQSLTIAATWTSSNTSVATISNTTGSNGLAIPLVAGTTQVTAAVGAVVSPPATLQAVTPAESVLYSFAGGSDGAYPYAGLIQATDGNFYGTTQGGGSTNSGTVYKITPAGIETVLYSFAGGNDGATPYARLVQGSDGNFYGTTNSGGSTGNGTVFKITPAGVETVLYSFAGGNDAANPVAGLIQGTDGNFYGTSSAGGTSGYGTMFKVTPAGVETVLHSFVGNGDGYLPNGGLIQASDGNFYGTTVGGGANVSGIVYKVTLAGVETVVYSFAGGSDGAYPYSELLQGRDGNFYGTTGGGGTGTVGTVFKLTPAGVETVLYSFAGGGDGAFPYAGLIQARDGNFYGTTKNGGSANNGTLFKITPAGVETMLYPFAGGADGATPYAALVQGVDGDFYGTTPYGGAHSVGVVFKY